MAIKIFSAFFCKTISMKFIFLFTPFQAEKVEENEEKKNKQEEEKE